MDLEDLVDLVDLVDLLDEVPSPPHRRTPREGLRFMSDR